MIKKGKNRMNKEQKKRYMKDQSKCPYCGSTSLTGKSFDTDSGSVSQFVTCSECGKSWRDVYTFSDVEEV